MPVVSVSELKAHLAKYLRLARRGVDVEVLDRGVPVARISGSQLSPSPDRERLARLVEAGFVKRGSGKASAFVGRERVRVEGAKLSSALVDERDERV